jgi:hypothetical protein
LPQAPQFELSFCTSTQPPSEVQNSKPLEQVIGPVSWPPVSGIEPSGSELSGPFACGET